MMSDETAFKVLIADGDKASALHLSECLTRAGHEVAIVARGDDAFASVHNDQPDLLIVNRDLPDGAGDDLCRQLRNEALPSYLYILMLTDSDDPRAITAAFDAGADFALSRPIQVEQLMARLKSTARLLKMERQLRSLSNIDALTGIYNRRTFYEMAKREWSRAIRHETPLACVVLDVDFFKKINDTQGHQVGDVTIQTVANLLRARSRPSDIVCRYGGEEFVVLLPHTPEDGAAVWAERIREELATIDIPAPKGAFRVTASFGVAERLDDTASPENLVELADQALLVAKQSGRDRVVRFRSIHAPSAWQLPTDTGPKPFGEIRACDVMAAIVLTLDQDETLHRAAEFLLQLRIGSAPVTNDEGRLVGIISEKDLMTTIHQPNSWNVRIRDVMKTNVVCYNPDVPAEDVFKFLCRVSIRRVVVVDDGRPIGVISRDSLLRWFFNWRSVTAPGAKQEQESGFVLRRGLQRVARTVAERAQELPNHLRNHGDNFVPSVIGEATRMQELINDMLGHCQRLVCSEAFGAGEEDAVSSLASYLQSQGEPEPAPSE